MNDKWGKQMKKSVSVLWIAILIAALVLSAGCGAKSEASPSGTASSSGTAETSTDPTESGGAKPSAKPSDASGDPTAEATDAESADPSSDASSETSSEASAKPSSSPKTDSGKDYAALGFALLENDGLGLIKNRMSESDLIYLLGEPETKSEPELWGADGLNHSSWSYPDKGLEIGMAQLPDDTEGHVFSITATAPCTLATARGIAIGSAKDDVLSAYKNEIDPNANEDTDSWITVGSVYGGMGIGIENGAVTYIFIGASAE